MNMKVRPDVAVFRAGGAMFSSVWAVTGFLQWAEENLYDPLIDMQTVKPANYWVSSNPRNAWRDYFEQTSDHNLDQVLARGEFVLFDQRPRSFPVQEYSQHAGYVNQFHRHIRLEPETQAYVDSWLAMFRGVARVLGVHFRGTDMRVAPSHWAPPTKFQMLKTIDSALERAHFDLIFVATEDQNNLDALRKRYGSLVVTTDSFRTRESSKLSRMDSPVLQWRFLLGRQVIRDTWLLGHCAGLVSGHSNVSEHAQVIAQNDFIVNLQIRRPQVDVLGSGRFTIALSNFLREATVSRLPGRDFRVIER